MVLVHRDWKESLAGVLLALAVLSGCGEEDEGGGIPDDPATACNEANEDCAPGICGGEGGRMLPGSDCMACHRAGSDSEVGRDGPFFTAAGTLYDNVYGDQPVAGATVRITDAEGKVVELTTNAVGNFYTSEPLTAPLRAEVERDGRRLEMPDPVDSGACTTCHRCDGMGGGKLYAP